MNKHYIKIENAIQRRKINCWSCWSDEMVVNATKQLDGDVLVAKSYKCTNCGFGINLE